MPTQEQPPAEATAVTLPETPVTKPEAQPLAVVNPPAPEPVPVEQPKPATKATRKFTVRIQDSHLPAGTYEEASKDAAKYAYCREHKITISNQVFLITE